MTRDWRLGALCASHCAPDFWYSDDPGCRAAAVAVCGACPARDACADAGRGEEWGVWSGVELGDRFELLLASPEPPEPVHSYPACKCARCTEAHRSRIAEWRDRDRHERAREKGPEIAPDLQLSLEIPA